ncbi:MAG: FAD-dependent monooxygenase [Candidatus Obscuribacterales bacterium]|nr:FAD-dependent monooxygenase [Candidatus Obscuribacterales bacterium]
MARTAIIIGAGIGGLSAAIALRKAGIKVEIFEKASALKEVGAGIVLYPNALEALKALDVYDRVVAEGAIGRRGKYLTAKGKVLAELNIEIAGRSNASVAIHRADLQRALADQAGHERIYTGLACTNIHSDGRAGVTLSDGSTHNADFVVGADGLHSVVRAALLHDGAPKYSGCFAWRGVSELTHPGLPPETGIMLFGTGLQFGAIPIGKGRTYWFGCVAAKAGMKGRTSKEHAMETFRGWTDPVVPLIESTSEILTHDLYDRDPSNVWGKKYVSLLGDAAHPMTPFMGQGGCQALEDSVTLASCLKNESNTEKALRRYESLRKPRTASFVHQSRNSGAVSLSSSPLVTRVRDLILPLIPSDYLIRKLHTLSDYELPNL